MPPFTPAVALDADAVRRILNDWSSHGLMRVRQLGDKVKIVEILSRSSYTVKVQSQYESRSMSRGTEAYHGGPVDDAGVPPGPWDMGVDLPGHFQERTEVLRIPHTDRVETCGHCHGNGRVTCGMCHGNGRVVCTTCGGTGMRAQTQTITEHNPQGQPVTRTETTQIPCTCFGGRVTCASCTGMGTQGCGPCASSGRVRTFGQLTVQFQCPALTKVFQSTELPEYLLHSATGTTLVDERADQIDTCPAVSEEVDALANSLLQESRAQIKDQTRMHFQTLNIQHVSIQEVLYEYSSSSVRKLWIYGRENHVHAPGAPRTWGRLLAILGGVAAVIAIAAAVIAMAAR